ncbi:hypothetical protein EXIGLDRAFT_731502 [Exidia glandulosa HHB12029]|uniref:Uncharacterized protein n=1 Tax=Exidia glandulosa HHB12029 TaxID=1314781 RepID=A0A165BVH9_EXIGL|nr:hypothetical protein EXIGLDRAFT_731502 [Exidia glandulosa HHB12029]
MTWQPHRSRARTDLGGLDARAREMRSERIEHGRTSDELKCTSSVQSRARQHNRGRLNHARSMRGRYGPQPKRDASWRRRRYVGR